MTRGLNYLWYSDQFYGDIRKTNDAGTLLATFDPDDPTLKDLAWDGTHIWAINTSGTIKRFTTSGALVRTISGLLSGGWGLTFDGTYLWASDPNTDKIYQISIFEVVQGDINGDGSVDLLDLVSGVNHIIGIRILGDDALSRADCNGDGVIDLLDLLGIVNVILGRGECEPGSCKPASRAEAMGVFQALRAYLGAEDFARFMEIVGQAQIPDEYGLAQNAPNPFNPYTDIRYQIPDGSSPVHTTLKISNILGQEVRTLVDEVREPGSYIVTWDGKDSDGKQVAGGVYFYRLVAGNFAETKRMVLLK